GFASLYSEKNDEKSNETTKEFEELSKALEISQQTLESIEKADGEKEKLQKNINDEGKFLYPKIKNISLLQGKTYSGSGEIVQNVGYILTGTGFSQNEKTTLKNWIKLRTKQENMKVFFEVEK
ncbi:hypothetical protein KGV52_01350, partial [Candidatus Gracilibacteria bacterium]|nr:hypothetical protein [Candidatus Gracilibacteria bacterium]